MKRVGMLGVVIVALIAVACRTTGEGTQTPGETDRVKLRLDERYVDPSGGLEVQPVSIGVNRATLVARVDGLTRTVELVAGPLGRETIAPYTFELVSTSLEPSVTIAITRR
jgi:hypothetical protein